MEKAIQEWMSEVFFLNSTIIRHILTIHNRTARIIILTILLSEQHSNF